MPNRMKIWLLSFAALSSFCPLQASAEQSIAPAPSAAPAAPSAGTEDSKAQNATPALWVVRDHDTTIFLFGTVHLLKPGTSWLHGHIKRAFDQSDEVMLEVLLPDNQAETMQRSLSLAMNRGGPPISSKLSPQELTAYRQALAEYGSTPAQFDMFKPWFAAVTLSTLPLSKMGYDPNKGVEKILTDAATKAGKRLSAFETLEEQLGFFDNLPLSAQLDFLNSSVRDHQKIASTVDGLVMLWASGQAEPLAEAVNESLSSMPALADILLYQRNARWADQLKTRMDQPGVVFVAVGAGHLAGEKSVQDYLKKKGLTVERLDAKP